MAHGSTTSPATRQAHYYVPQPMPWPIMGSFSLFCLILGLDKHTSAMLAAFGAIGVGFGGQMTYGQTIGFIVQPETFFRGLLGLSVKGGIWGLIADRRMPRGFLERTSNIQRRTSKFSYPGLLDIQCSMYTGHSRVNDVW